MLNGKKNLLFVGVCGNGMAPLAIYSSQKGYKVYGFDDFENKEIKDILISQKVAILPNKTLTKHCNIVVYSSAINPESDEIIKQAKEANIPCIRRGEWLQKITNDKKLIAITGSHGKTSVCAAMAEIIIHNSINSDYILGGFFKKNKYFPSHYSTENKYVVAEIDESDLTIDLFNPHTTIILNFDDDHTENYNGINGLIKSFENIISRTTNTVLIQNNCSLFNEMLDKTTVNVTKFDKQNNIDIAKTTSQEIFYQPIDTNLEFVGTKYRNDILGIINNITFIQDYAHHPTEVKALFRTMHASYANSKLHIFFQPHRFSRTEKFQAQFAQALDGFNEIFLLPIYSAFETNIHNISSKNIFDILTIKNKHLVEINNIKDVVKNCFNCVHNDMSHHVFVFVGAGSITKFSNEITNEIKLQELCKNFQQNNIQCLENTNIKNETTLKIGNAVRLFVLPSSIEQLQHIMTACKNFDIQPEIIGRGSNLLISDEICQKLFLKLNNKEFAQIEWGSKNILRCGAYVKLQKIFAEVSKKNFSGFENLAGIPGTIGGAVVMNAGAHQHSISEFVKSIETINQNGEKEILQKSDINFQYRKTFGLENRIITHVNLEFTQKDSYENIHHKFNDLRLWRIEKQPQQPSAGSVFKNPQNHSAGYLIEQSGLKGLSQNGIEISTKHANFFINTNNGSASAFEKLIDLAQYKVYENFDIFLENEIKIIREI